MYIYLIPVLYKVLVLFFVDLTDYLVVHCYYFRF